MTPEVITLADGRRLRWRDFGDPGGLPVLYTAGTLHVSESSGHDVGADRSAEITSVLASCLR